MKKTTRALTLLTATALTFGSAMTIAPTVANAVEAQEQTMADQYEPYFEDLIFNEIEYPSKNVYLMSEAALPKETTYVLLDHGQIATDWGTANGLSWLFRKPSPNWISNAYLYVGINETSKQNPLGNTATPRILIQYPDGSSEIVTAKLTGIPTNANGYQINYGNRPNGLSGQTNKFTPISEYDIPAGTKYSIVPDPEGNSNYGDWEYTIDGNTGVVSLTVPEGHSGSGFNLMINILYPDGSTGYTTLNPSITIPEPPYEEPVPLPSDRSYGSSSS